MGKMSYCICCSVHSYAMLITQKLPQHVKLGFWVTMCCKAQCWM